MDAHTFIYIGGCLIIGLLAFLLGRRGTYGSGVSGTSGCDGSARELNTRATEDNRRLEDAERESADTIREQAEDIGRAEANANAVGNLIKKGKEILERHSSDK